MDPFGVAIRTSNSQELRIFAKSGSTGECQSRAGQSSPDVSHVEPGMVFVIVLFLVYLSLFALSTYLE